MSTGGYFTETAQRNDLTTAEKRAIIAELVEDSNKGVQAHGDMKRVAAMFDGGNLGMVSSCPLAILETFFPSLHPIAM